jgi:hypothetical protein
VPTDNLLEYRVLQLEDADLENRVTKLETSLGSVPDQLSSIRGWLMTVLGGIIVALALLVMDLSIGYHPAPPAPSQHGVVYSAPSNP